MSIQRWTWKQVGEAGPKEAMYVTYADHVAAVTEAEQRVSEEWFHEMRKDGRYSKGAADERARIKALITEIVDGWTGYYEDGMSMVILDAIDGEGTA